MKQAYVWLAVALLALSAVSADAQIRLGVKGGMSFSTFVGENQLNIPFEKNQINLDISNIRDGFAGGGFATLQIARWFAVQPEFMYVQKGGKANVFGAAVTWKVDYFEIPLLARLNIPISTASFYLFGGPSIAFNTGSKIDATVFGQTFSQNIDITKSSDWDATFGAGLEVPVGPVYLSFDARYTLGLTDIVNIEEKLSQRIGVIDIPDIWDGRNGTLLLLLGVGFQVTGGGE